MSPQRWRLAALVALWALVAATFGLAAYTLWRAQPITEFSVMGALRSFLAALVLVWWTVVFGRYTSGVAVPEADGTLRALRAVFPWLAALRLSLWGLEAVALASGAAETASPVAVTALVTISLGFILARNAVFGTLARWAPTPDDAVGRVRLAQWLNAAAALSLALGVVNVVPIAGLGSAPDLASSLIYGLHAALDVAAGLLALRAIQARRPASP